MSFYKIIKDGQVIDVNNKFFKVLRKHLTPIACEVKDAELIQSSSGEFYKTSWTNKLPDKLQVEQVIAVLISEEEYNSLKEQLGLDKIVVVEKPITYNIEQEEVIQEPKRVEKVINIKDLYEEIRQLKEELKSLKK